MLNHIKIASLSLAMTTFQECPIFCPKVSFLPLLLDKREEGVELSYKENAMCPSMHM